MRAVVQRVSQASVSVNGKVVGHIASGLVVFLGVGKDDAEPDAEYLAEKVAGLRVFQDSNGKMNLAVGEKGGAVLVVSQFTLYGDCRRGKRPSFTEAAPPEKAKKLYEYFIQHLQTLGVAVQSGEFQEMMQVDVRNDGPVTILLESKKEF